MNVDRILHALNDGQVLYILIGGMNFLLRHKPVLTFDVDIWIEDSEANRERCERVMAQLEAEWGSSDQDWKPVSHRASGWLAVQAVYCLTSPLGAIDIFRRVCGLDEWSVSRATATPERTAGGVDYVGLSDEDMLKCQYALEPALRKLERIEILESAIREAAQHDRS
ncbi:MAG: hypothetical protein ACYC6N_31360 [Pirellulaceae bacterium]